MKTRTKLVPMAVWECIVSSTEFKRMNKGVLIRNLDNLAYEMMIDRSFQKFHIYQRFTQSKCPHWFGLDRPSVCNKEDEGKYGMWNCVRCQFTPAKRNGKYIMKKVVKK